MSHVMRKSVFEVSNQVRHKPAYARTEEAKTLKFWVYAEEELHFLCSESKGADQLGNYCEADQRLCFRIGKNMHSPYGVECLHNHNSKHCHTISTSLI